VQTTVTAPDGTTLVVRRTGDGEPVVLVHGSAGSLDSWDPVLPFLAGFEVWVHARRGYPPSRPARDKTFADDVADLGAVLAAVGEQPHLVGGSYGGTVALHAARAMPETMDALARAITHARRAVLDGQLHFATHTAPDVFAEELVGFLRRGSETDRLR